MSLRPASFVKIFRYLPKDGVSLVCSSYLSRLLFPKNLGSHEMPKKKIILCLDRGRNEDS